MTSRIGFRQRVRNPDVRANIAIYSNSELGYPEVELILLLLLSTFVSPSYFC